MPDLARVDPVTPAESKSLGWLDIRHPLHYNYIFVF